MGYVERNAGGWTELRVHGVAGTAPESVLEHPHAAQVAGNEDAGFLRRLWEARSVSADTPRRRREAYSWGGLTSGDNTRALWLLLLPFMLLNVAFYMTPYRRPPGSTDRTDRPPRPGRRRGATRAGAVVHRDLHPHHHRGRDGPGRLAVRGRATAGRRRLRHLLAELAQLGMAGPARPAGRGHRARPAGGGGAALGAGREHLEPDGERRDHAGAPRLRDRDLHAARGPGDVERPGHGAQAAGGPRRDGRDAARRVRARDPGVAGRVAAARPAARPAGGDADPGDRPGGVEPPDARRRLGGQP